MQDKEDLAVSEGRIISPQEAVIRKKIGLVVLGVTLFTLLAYKPSREAYGPVSFAMMAGFGLYQTGVRSLWGCVLNLKTNFDGKGFKEPSEKNLDFIKSKRNEFIGLFVGGHLLGIVIALAAAAYMGHSSKKVTMSVLKWQLGGLLVSLGLSLNAKWF